MGEQRGFAPLLTVDLASVTVELNLCESGARFPCKWSSVLEIYILRLLAKFMHSKAMPMTQNEVSGRCAMIRLSP